MMLGMKNVLSTDSWDFVHTHVGNLEQQIMGNILEGKMMEKFPLGNQFKQKLYNQWKIENSGNE